MQIGSGTWDNWRTGGQALGSAGAKQFVLELPGGQPPGDERRQNAPLQRAQAFRQGCAAWGH